MTQPEVLSDEEFKAATADLVIQDHVQPHRLREEGGGDDPDASLCAEEEE